MPAGFAWCTMDVNDDAQMDEIYRLLFENYVEDDDNMFRFDYSPAFLRWALTPPGYNPEFHVGVRNTKTGALMGFITGVPAQLKVHDHVLPVVEINFLCVHKSLR
jgi:glycylpeptide N-tetradecanoyltransferase